MFALVRKIAFLGLTTSILGGCGPAHDPDAFWRDTGLSQGSEHSDLALGAISRNDLKAAESHADRALAANPRNPYALYAAGLVYQNTGRPRKAKAAFEEMLAVNPDGPATVAGPGNLTTRQLGEMAITHLKSIDPNWTPPQGLRIDPTGFSQPMPPPPPPPSVIPDDPRDAAVVQRFRILRTLLDESLVTDQEYQVRRARNVGGLVPLTSKPPAAGLDRPVTAGSDIIDRLKALRKAFEIRAITAAEHQAERTMILDALLPAHPAGSAPPAPPPPGIIETGMAAARLERLHQAALISTDEMAREKRALEAAVRGPGAVPEPAAKKPAAKPAAAAKPKPAQKPKPTGLHLGSFSTKAAAQEGWNEIKKQFSAEIGKLRPNIKEIKTGKSSVEFRLVAGPVSNTKAAQGVCGKLKAKNQYCQPSAF